MDSLVNGALGLSTPKHNGKSGTVIHGIAGNINISIWVSEWVIID